MGGSVYVTSVGMRSVLNFDTVPSRVVVLVVSSSFVFSKQNIQSGLFLFSTAAAASLDENYSVGITLHFIV